MATIWGTQGSDSIDGTASDDILRGWAETGGPATDLGDQLSGLDGEDRIFGGGGDELDGGAGSGMLSGGDGADLLLGYEGEDWLNGGDGKDEILSFEDADTLFGGAASDNLDGGAGPDALFGEQGNDILAGRIGQDLLSGGGGSDVFAFRRGDGKDTIIDFKDDIDRLLLGADLGVTSKADALMHASVEDGDTVFRFDTGDVLIVKNIADPILLKNDFITA